MDKNLEDLILKYVLQNAIRYKGKANQNVIIGKLFSAKPELKKDKKNLSKIFEQIKSIVKKVNSMKLEDQENLLKKLAPELLERKIEKKELPELKNIKDKVVMRLAPYPSGPLHIGNAKPFLLNDYYVKKYKGNLLLVIDDTIGSEEKMIVKDAYNLIIDGLNWLNIKFDKKIYYKSDRLDIYYKYAEILIKKNKAYVCFCNTEELRENRFNKKECKHRNNSVENNLSFWKDILANKYKEGQATLRIKTSMQHKNPAFRDRVLFRISNRSHPRVKNKYSVWPLLEFSWAVDDHLLNITHILRGKDLMIESEMEKYIWNILNWKHPEIIYTGLLKIESLKLSKSKSQKEVLSKKYIGWDDPRTFSLQSLKRRNFKADAIRNFLFSTGLTLNDVTVPIETLYNENRKIIEPIANRYFFINDPVKIKIENSPNLNVEINLHPDFPERGTRKFKTKNEFYISSRDYKLIEENNLYRLMECLNFAKKGNKFIFHSKEYEKFKADGKMIMHWLPVEKDLVNVEVLMEDGTLAKGLGESLMKNLKFNTVIQGERFGFIKLDKKEKDKLVFWFTHK